MAMPALPADLLIDIFQNLRGGLEYSKTDLMSCTLVSKTWRIFALEPLFSEISLGFFHESVENNYPADNDGRPDYPTLPTFIRFLKSSPRIAACVQKLTLIYREYDPDEDFGLDDHYVSHLSLLSVLSETSHLQSLRLCDFLLDMPKAPNLDATELLRRPARTLNTLHLDYPELSGDSGVPFYSAEILAPLKLFTSIENLILRNAILKAASHISEWSQLGIRRLRLEEVDSVGHLLGDLRPTHVLCDLNSLDVGCIIGDDLENLHGLLDIVRHRLTDFSCAFASERIQTDEPGTPLLIDPSHPLFNALDLSRCHSLASINFQFVLFHNASSNQMHAINEQQWRCAITMLSCLGSDPKAPPLSIAFSIDTSPLDGIIAEHLLDLWPIFGEVEDELCRLIEERRLEKVQVTIRRWGVEMHDDYSHHIFPRLGITGHLAEF